MTVCNPLLPHCFTWIVMHALIWFKLYWQVLSVMRKTLYLCSHLRKSSKLLIRSFELSNTVHAISRSQFLL